MKFSAGNVVTGVVLIALAVLFGLYSLANNTTRRYDDRAFDYFTALRTFSQEQVVEEAAIVLIDESAISPFGYYDPVPRRYLANLIDSLNARQSAVIALDIALLDRFVADPVGDSLLAGALQRAGNVIGICLQEERSDSLYIRQPDSLFVDHLYDIGHAMLEVGGGVFGRVKGIRPFIEQESDSIPAFGLVLAEHYSGREIKAPKSGVFGLRLNYSGPPGKWEQAGGGWIQVEEGAIPTYRSSLLTGKTPLPAALFKERVVFIGGGIETAKDRFYTPFATAVFDERLMHGVEVHANAFLMFLNNSYLPSVSEYYQYLLFILTAILAVGLGMYFGLFRSMVGLIILIATIWLGSYLVFVLQSLWIPVTGLTATSLCGYLTSVMAGIYQRYRIERRSRIISHYALEKQLGEGAMGNVFLARDKESGKKVAVKVLHEELVKDEKNQHRLNSEGFILSSFNHPNIVKAYEVGDSGGRKFIAMEYLSCGTLADFLKDHHPLTLRQIKGIALQICSALKEIHGRNIIHRDLKTSNIMLDDKGKIRVMDFGLSKSALIRTQTSAGGVIGTLGYTAPEQITNRTIDCRSDIFSFGVVLYEMLTNQSPFRGENEISIMHSIFNDHPASPSLMRDDNAGAFDVVVERCIAKNPENRFATISEVADALKSMD